MKWRITKDERSSLRSMTWPYVVESKTWIFPWSEQTRYETQKQAEWYIEEIINPKPVKVIKEYSITNPKE